MLILGAVLDGCVMMSRWRLSAAVRRKGLATAFKALSVPAPSSLTSGVTPDRLGTSPHFFVSKMQMIITVPPS